MAPEHFSKLLSDGLELLIHADGTMTYSDIENMYVDELYFFIYNFKKFYDDKMESKKEFIKGIMQFAQKAINTLIQAISGKKNG